MNLSNIKLVLLDLDGTLLRSDGSIGEKSLKYSKLLKEKGILVTFASGRMSTALEGYAKEMSLEGIMICSDGAVIMEYPSGRVLRKICLKDSKVKKGIELSEKHLVKMVMCTDSEVLYTEHNEATLQLIDRFGARFRCVDDYRNISDEVIELVYVGENRHSFQEIKKHFSFPYSFGLKLTYSKSQSHYQYYLEVKKDDVSKASALTYLNKKLGISIKDTIVIGDWYNDVALFKTKALKVSLTNAVPEIKYLSDLKLEFSNDEDGVGELLERIYKQK
ncbi:MAG: Cof-type HAD-IIB family hydrolase [Bacteroidetes bacterium]|nr:Cof-type HAD-IIB family hydrolase [Bacteroidota bacterium]